MVKVKFKWISRAKFNALPVKDIDTIYFIYNEHVLYKGNQEYGGVQAISYTIDSDGDYIISITNGDGTITQLQISSSARLKQALELLDAHIITEADETTSAHVKITDTIDTVTPQDVNDNVAVTPKAVVNYVTSYQGKTFLKYPTFIALPLVGNEDIIYLVDDTGYLYIYKNQAYRLIADNWRSIDEIHGIIN